MRFRSGRSSRSKARFSKRSTSRRFAASIRMRSRRPRSLSTGAVLSVQCDDRDAGRAVDRFHHDSCRRARGDGLMPSITTWYRIEPRARSADLSQGDCRARSRSSVAAVPSMASRRVCRARRRFTGVGLRLCCGDDGFNRYALGGETDAAYDATNPKCPRSDRRTGNG